MHNYEVPVFVNGHGFLVRLEGEVIKKLPTSAPGSIPVQKNTSIESNIDNNELLLKLQATEVSNLYVIRKQKVLFQIIDKNGALKLEQSEKSSFRTENLKIAQKMAAKGEDENSIRFATGWKKKPIKETILLTCSIYRDLPELCRSLWQSLNTVTRDNPRMLL